MTSWFSKLDERKAPNVKKYLIGLRQYNYLSLYTSKPYNHYPLMLSPILAYVGVKILKNSLRLEFDRREQPNIFIPKTVYKIRRQHYVYWEISRLARGLPKTFTYSTWDPKAAMMYHVDLKGEMLYEKLNLREERIDLI